MALEELSEAIAKDITGSRKRLDKLDCLQAGWRDMQHLLTTFGTQSPDPILNDRLAALENYLQEQKNAVARETSLRRARIEVAEAFLKKIAEAASLYKAQSLEEANRNPAPAGADAEAIVTVSREVVSGRNSLNLPYYSEDNQRRTGSA